MLENYFCVPKTLHRLRVGLSGPYIDGFADSLERVGYADASAIRYLRLRLTLAASCIATVAHWRTWTLAVWRPLDATFVIVDALIQTAERRLPRAVWSEALSPAFDRAWNLPQPFARRCRRQRACACNRLPRLAASASWCKQTDSSAVFKRCQRVDQSLGEGVAKWTVRDVRDFVLDRAGKCGAPTTRNGSRRYERSCVFSTLPASPGRSCSGRSGHRKLAVGQTAVQPV